MVRIPDTICVHLACDVAQVVVEVLAAPLDLLDDALGQHEQRRLDVLERDRHILKKLKSFI